MAAARAKKGKPEETEAEKLRKEEQAIMADITRKTALKGVKELATARPPTCSARNASGSQQLWPPGPALHGLTGA